MNEQISQILGRMAALEDELAEALQSQEHRMFFQLHGKRVAFEASVKTAHRKLRQSLLRWLLGSRPQNLLTGPIIYGMLLPMLLFDLCVSVYQWTCFPIYRITRVRRGDYIVFDRHQLGYLNAIEKFHCSYCEYGNGLIAYAREVLARTEEYFCPIKHARSLLGRHARYHRFLDYGDAEHYQERLEAFRVGLGQLKSPGQRRPR